MLREVLVPRDARARRRRDRVLAGLFAVLAVVLVARAARKELGVLLRNQEWGARFVERVDPYFDPARGERMHGPYPPSYALVTAPLSLVPTRVARVGWAAAQVGALLALYALLRRRVRILWPALAPHAPVLYAAALLLASRYLLRDTAAGGGNLLYATLAFAGLELSLARRELAAGPPVALGLVLKPNLAPLLLFYLLRGRWRTLASTAVAAAVLFWLPGLHYGLGDYARLAGRWADETVRFAALEDLHDHERVPEGMPPAENAMNQSLREAVHRLLRPPGDTGAPDVHVARASPAAAAWAARAASALLVLAAAAAALRARSPRAVWISALAFLPLSVLLSPIAWKAHHVALLPLLFALVCAASQRDRARWLAPLLVLYYVACDLPSHDLVGDEANLALQALSLVTWGAVALLAAALLVARREDRRAAAGAP